MGSSLKYRDIFVWFITMQEKHILSKVIGIRKENWGTCNYAFLGGN